MKKGNIYTVPHRRKRQGRTNYKKRLNFLLSQKPRLVVRKSSRNFIASIVEFDGKGDKVLASVNSKSLNKIGWNLDNNNLPTAYLTGLLAGKKAMEKGIKEAILDLGFNKITKGSRIYAVLAGALDAGLQVPHDESVLPAQDRINGEHITKYASLLKENQEKFKKQFSSYLKKGINPEEISKKFNDIKGKING